MLHALGLGAAALPPAEFDAGGMTFDLEKISAARFHVPTGGLSGCVERVKDSDSHKPAIVSFDWKNADIPKFPRKVTMRYRLRVDRFPSDRKLDILLKWYSCWVDKHGRKRRHPGPRYRIQDTAGEWCEVCLSRIPAARSSERVEFEFDLNGCLGKLEYKDLRLSAEEDPRGPGKEYMIETIVRPMSFLDGSFALASGQPQMMYFSWRLLDPDLKPDIRKWSVSLDLPPGVKCLSSLNCDRRELRNVENPDGSSTISFNAYHNHAPHRYWNHWFPLVFLVSSDLPPGTTPGVGVFKAFHDGRLAAKPTTVRFSVIEPVVADSVPRRYFNGICIPGDPICSHFREPGTADALARTWSAAGVRSCNGGHPTFHAALRSNGVNRISAPYRRICDGYVVNPPIGNRQVRPADQRFVPYEASFAKDRRIAQATCPIAVYEEASYFKDVVLPELKKHLAGYSCLEANWEPDAYFRKGCACRKCCAAFARYLGLPEEDVAKDWPANVREGGRFESKIERFRAIEHGKVVKTIHRYVCEFTGGDESQGLIPEITWAELSDSRQYDFRQGEVDSAEYLGALRWVNPWGPYVWWDVNRPYIYRKHLPLASYVAAKNVRERVDRENPPGRRPKLLSFPSGWQIRAWLAVPEWIELAMDSFFFNRWEGTEVYSFPSGYDARYWKSFAAATSRAGRCEDAVLDGVRADDRTFAVPVPEYAANCREATGFLPQITDVSMLQAPAYDWKGGRTVGLMNFWEKGEAFLTLKLQGLQPGSYTVISEGRTLWTGPSGGTTWSHAELASGLFAAVGAATTVDFAIRPAAEHAEKKAVDAMSQDMVRALYEKARGRLEKEAAKDRASESMRGLLYPDTLPQI